jgi:hypothetical protein
LNIDPQLEAKRRTSMTMQDWEVRLGGFLKLWDREVLQGAGKVTADIAKAHAAFFSASVHLCFLSASSLLRSTLSASKTLIASADTTAAKFGSPAVAAGANMQRFSRSGNTDGFLAASTVFPAHPGLS